MSTRFRVMPFALAALSFHLTAAAQWTQQTIRLQPGWNAVFFEVEPQPRDCDTVFRGIPVESVWAWNRRFTSVQFVEDPNTLLAEAPRWLGYFPPTSPQADMTTLYIVQGGRAYLVKLGGTQAVNLVLKGRPKIRPVEWLADSYNLMGFHLAGSGAPTFASFFASSPAHVGQKIFRLNTAGQWIQVANPAIGYMKAGEAYWMFCKGKSEFQGPLSVTFEVGDGLDYARILTEQTLRIKNASTVDRTITLAPRSSDPPPTTSFPLVSGSVPLSYLEKDLANKKYGRNPLTSPLTLSIPAGSELALPLSVRRADMAPFTPPPGREALYQSLLDLRDGAGSLLVLPVSAEGMSSPRLAGPPAAPLRRPGVLGPPPCRRCDATSPNRPVGGRGDHQGGLQSDLMGS